MAKQVERSIKKPKETTASRTEKIVEYGVRTPGSNFNRRPEVGSNPAYLGLSKTEERSSAIKDGSGQKKKHPSAGKGQ